VVKVNKLYVRSPVCHFWYDVSVGREHLSCILEVRNIELYDTHMTL